MTGWAGRHVVLGVSGGIASYKACFLARRLTEAGAAVDVVMTRSAGEFVRPVTFAALTDRPVYDSLWAPATALSHVRLGQDADVVIVAPATAQLIARMAQGLADDHLTSLLLAAAAPILLAPAMNDSMFAHEATGENLARLRARGVAVVGPESGPLAEGPSDRPGRMSEPETIMAHAARLVRGTSALAGRRVLVTAGPTREALDPVRVLTNRSSGKMGYRLAEAAWERGAEVTLVSGPVSIDVPVGVRLRRVDSTAEMESAVRDELPTADVLVMAAAPADFRPATSSDAKRPRGDGPVSLSLQPTADILLATRECRRAEMVVVGFALETGDALSRGRGKLERKGLDLIVVNDALEAGAGFEHDTNRVTLLDREGGSETLPLLSKREVAEAILDAVERRIG